MPDNSPEKDSLDYLLWHEATSQNSIYCMMRLPAYCCDFLRYETKAYVASFSGWQFDADSPRSLDEDRQQPFRSSTIYLSIFNFESLSCSLPRDGFQRPQGKKLPENEPNEFFST